MSFRIGLLTSDTSCILVEEEVEGVIPPLLCVLPRTLPLSEPAVSQRLLGELCVVRCTHNVLFIAM